MKISRYVICLILMFLYTVSNVYADETKNEENITIETKLTEEEIKEQKEILQNEIYDLIEQIREKIVDIDDRIIELKNTDEYNTYPTIRLNIDTPIFGLKSIINQKLRISKDVSAADVAKGYSLRYIIKNRVVKVPVTKIGNIVVSTEEIDIDSDLEITDYNNLILKLMNYKEKVNSIYSFLNDKTNKMFKEYVSKEKKEKLNEFASRLNEINKTLLDEDKELTILYMMENEAYSDISKEYLSLKEKKKSLDGNISNVLIETSKLNDVQKNIISLEAEVIDFTEKIQNIADENDKINIDKVYLKVYSNMKERYSKIEEYVKNSEKEIEIETVEDTSKVNNTDNKNSEDKNTQSENTQKNNEEKKSENKSESKNEKVVTTEVEKIYDVFSKKYLDTMKSQITSLEQKMDDLEISYKENESQKSDEKIDSNSDKKTSEKSSKKYQSLSEEEINNNVEEILTLYNTFLNNQYSFYLDNLNGTLNNTNLKLRNLAEYTSADVITHIQYIYIDLPSTLEDYLEKYDINSTIEIKRIISSFNNELEKLLEEYLNILKLYEEYEVEEIISKT